MTEKSGRASKPSSAKKAAGKKPASSKASAGRSRSASSRSSASSARKTSANSRTSKSSSRSSSTGSGSKRAPAKTSGSGRSSTAARRSSSSGPKRATKRPTSETAPKTAELLDTEELEDEDDPGDEALENETPQAAATEPTGPPPSTPIATELKIARAVMWAQAALLAVFAVFVFANTGGGPNDLNSRLESARTEGRLSAEVATAAEDLDNAGQNDLADQLEEKGAVTVKDVEEIRESPAAERRASARGAFRTIFGIIVFTLMALLALAGRQIGRAKWRIGTLVIEGFLLLPTVIGLATGNFNVNLSTISPVLAATTIVLLFTPNASRSFVRVKSPELQDASRFDIRKMGSID